MIIEVSNVSDEQIQTGLGKAFSNFCDEYKGAGITANVLTDDAAVKVQEFINQKDY